MPVRKLYGYQGGGTSPIRRHPFRGDPADQGVEHNPEPISARGKRRRADPAAYQAAREARKNTSAPTRRGNCGPKLRGLHPRPKYADPGGKDWEDYMWDASGRANKEYDHGTR